MGGEELPGSTLRTWRKGLGLSQAALSRALGVAPNTVARWERNELRIANPERLFAALRTLAAEAGGLVPIGANASNDTGRPHAPAWRLAGLPAHISQFIGRQREIADIQKLLKHARLVTLAGAGGIGKTRLALEVANTVLQSYPDGAWFIELGSTGDPVGVPQTVAAVLGITEEVDKTLVETIERTIRHRRQLLLLDNCEHLLDVTAELTNRILRASSGTQIVTTSREPLGISGEIVWRVPSLTLPDALSRHAARKEHSEAVQLFVDRARAARPDFEFTNENALAIHEICRRVDGIPLAIELSAAWVSVLTPAQLLDQLCVAPHLLVANARTALPRHKTMAAAIQWSYDLLSESERRLFLTLSVFAGSFGLDAVAAISADDGFLAGEALELVRRLVAKSLLVAESDAECPTRYRVLEPLRDFARQNLLRTPDVNAMHRRHALFYASLARSASLAQLDRAGGPVHAALRREHDNLHASLRWLVEHGEFADALMVGTAVAEIWRQRGHLNDARAMLAQLMTVARCESSAGRAGIQLLAGQLASYQGDLEAARALLEESVALSRALGLWPGVTRGLIRIADIERAQGRFQSAQALVEAALLACPTTDAVLSSRVAIRFELALIDLDEQRYAEAEALARQCLPILRSAGWTRVIAQALLVLGACAAEAGRHAQARKFLDESLAQWRQSDKWGAARTLVELSKLHAKTGDTARAAHVVGEAIRLAQDIGDPWATALALETAAGLAAQAARHADGLRLAEASAALRERTGFVQSPRERAWLDAQLAASRSVLDSPRLTAAREAGRAMTLDNARQLALARTSVLRAARLTARELEVADLLARGLSDREIAARLVVTRRTAQSHVSNILGKLGLSSRAQVAVSVLRQGLEPEVAAESNRVSV